MLQGLAGLLGKVLRRTPLVVLLDDVHLADASSWEAVRYFARHLDDARLLVIATARPAELARHEVAAPVLFELEQDALLTRVEVGALARRPLRELTEAVIERPAPRALVDWVSERSQGNPLFAIGLLRALMKEGGDLSDPHLHRLPESLTERLISELRRLDAAPKEMLELMAVVGRPVSLGDLTALAGGPLEQVGPVLAELVDARIVVEEERAGELGHELQHPLVRDVIYQATGGARRRLLHRQAARSLLQTGHLAEAALHFARSAERGDSEAVEVLLDAMRQAERREAYREALQLQAELVELLPADDLLIVEPVAEDGQPVAPGKRSAKLYLTNLFNRALPLIRYEITDEVRILTERCPCGSTHRCVADIQGRLDDVFVYDGRRVNPHVFRSAFARHAGVVEYQVRQTRQGALIAVRCCAPVNLDRLRGDIARPLSDLGLSRPVVELTVVDRLERDAGPAKLRRFVPLAEPSPPPRESGERVLAAAH